MRTQLGRVAAIAAVGLGFDRFAIAINVIIAAIRGVKVVITIRYVAL